jgi:hypothetical protein
MGRGEWVAGLASAIGVKNLDSELLAKARRSAQVKRPGTRFALERLLELSFRAGKSTKRPVLRYAVDVAGISSADRASIMESCLVAVGRTGAATGLGKLLQEDPKAFEYIGAEHAASGAIIRSKTYWGDALSLQRILSVLPPELREMGETLDKSVLSLWPEWKTFRFVGIDFCATGPPRVKIYYPPRDCEGVLRINTLVKLCSAVRVPAPVDQFAKLCYLVLDKIPVVPATAFILGIVLGAESSLKLSIAPDAYRGGVRSARAKAEALAVAFELDPATLQAGAHALRRYCPAGNIPALETLCAEFPSGGQPRVLTYYRLRPAS